MAYADVYLVPLPKKNIAAYKKMALLGKKTWMKYGAVQYFETVGDELKMPWGLPFGKALKLKAGETVVAAWVLYKSKAHRNAVNKRVHADPIMHSMPKKMPFDAKRMVVGGFNVLVSS
jgi:alkaline phosphatase